MDENVIPQEYEVLGFNLNQVLTSDEMNHLELGIKDNNNAILSIHQNVETLDTRSEENTTSINNIKEKLTKYEDVNSDGNIVISYEDVTVT